MPIIIKSKGRFYKTEQYLNTMQNNPPWRSIMQKYAEEGLAALQFRTPKDSGITADAWYYEITDQGISYQNPNVTADGTPIVILLQYGHATKDGGYISPIDFINSALQPIFNKIIKETWQEVTRI